MCGVQQARVLKIRVEVYCLDVNIAKAVSTPKEMPGVLPWATDPDSAQRLWQLSEELAGVKFSI
ncbi:hypothetical protein CEQ21_01560 [Niallia circulans]|uniref:Uncharacterized protein n=1 Tax=Niallia circulans TaxID=1397 RepID=A0A553SRS2_NIACI|nr:hypothetical protein CEQ21_01560 [Niallia circulans]